MASWFVVVDVVVVVVLVVAVVVVVVVLIQLELMADAVVFFFAKMETYVLWKKAQ